MIRRGITRFTRSQDGGALVEFGILLPTLLIFLAVSVEGSRTFWSYQTTITGVRDAARYLSRVVPHDICDNGGSTTAWDAKLAEIVRLSQSGESLFPVAVSVDAVTSSLVCKAGDYRGGQAPVATVTAELQIGYPFASIFGLIGQTVTTVHTTVSDSARVLGS